MTHEHMNAADRLIYESHYVPDIETQTRLLNEAQARATLALAQEVRLSNLILVYGLMDMHNERLEHPLAEVILRRTIRRRLGLFPELSPDGDDSNGGI